MSQSTEEQDTRFQLREQFLKTLLYSIGKPVTFCLHENTTVTGIFSACDRDPLQVLVTDMMTPSGPQKQALLRMSDIVSFSVKLDESV